MVELGRKAIPFAFYCTFKLCWPLLGLKWIFPSYIPCPKIASSIRFIIFSIFINNSLSISPPATIQTKIPFSILYEFLLFRFVVEILKPKGLFPFLYYSVHCMLEYFFTQKNNIMKVTKKNEESNIKLMKKRDKMLKIFYLQAIISNENKY